MPTKTTSLSFLALLILGGPFGQFALAEDSPHWTKTGCAECHAEATPVAGKAELKSNDADALCESCHANRGNARSCRHASGVPADMMKLPDEMAAKLKGGNLVCSTCHDAVYQCEHPTKSYSFMNPGFLRGREMPDTSQYCFRCHDKADYQKLNPHNGIAGMPAKPTCMLCHESIPESNSAGGISISFNMRDDLNDMCLGCHNVRPHPKKIFSFSQDEEEDWVHLVRPSDRVMQNLAKAERERGLVLPLNPLSGEVFCGTCHNQHGFKAKVAEQQPKHRLRANDICQACHDK